MKNLSERVLIKQEVKLAFDTLKLINPKKKISQGILDLYNEIMLTNDFEKLKKLSSKFFGYVKVRKKWSDKFKS